MYTPTPELEKMTNSGETLEGPEQEDCHGNSPGKKILQSQRTPSAVARERWPFEFEAISVEGM